MKRNKHLQKVGYLATAVIFTVQLFVASFCFIIPSSAVAQTNQEPCHSQMAQHEMPAQSHQMDSLACAHCDAPQDIQTVSTLSDIVPHLWLVAVLPRLTDTQKLHTLTSPLSPNIQAPPNSAKLLYTTTQRIRI